MSHGSRPYDLVIVGGGPVGLCLAVALVSDARFAGQRLALVEGNSLDPVRSFAPSRETRWYSNRVSALSTSSIRFLKKIKAFEHLDKTRMKPFDSMRVLDGVSSSEISFDMDLLPTSAMGQVDELGEVGSEAFMGALCENINLQQALLKALEASSAELYTGAKVDSIALEDHWPLLRFAAAPPGAEGLAPMRTRLLVGADGPHSPVRTFAQIESHGWDYDALGLVATMDLVDSPSQADYIESRNWTAWQRMLPTGPVAFLPLPNGMATLVWSLRKDLAAIYKRLDPLDLVALVNAAYRCPWSTLDYLNGRLLDAEDTLSAPGMLRQEIAWRSEVDATSTVASLEARQDPLDFPPTVARIDDTSIAAFPLKMRHADTYHRPRLALVGDAAHTIHPLAGQGLNLGLADVEALSSVLLDGLTQGADLGSRTLLERYTSSRYQANNAVLGVCDKLNKLYGTTSAPIVAVRSLGLDLVNELAPIKSLFMRGAGGSSSPSDVASSSSSWLQKAASWALRS